MSVGRCARPANISGSVQRIEDLVRGAGRVKKSQLFSKLLRDRHGCHPSRIPAVYRAITDDDSRCTTHAVSLRSGAPEQPSSRLSVTTGCRARDDPLPVTRSGSSYRMKRATPGASLHATLSGGTQDTSRREKNELISVEGRHARRRCDRVRTPVTKFPVCEHMRPSEPRRCDDRLVEMRGRHIPFVGCVTEGVDLPE